MSGRLFWNYTPRTILKRFSFRFKQNKNGFNALIHAANYLKSNRNAAKAGQIQISGDEQNWLEKRLILASMRCRVRMR